MARPLSVMGGVVRQEGGHIPFAALRIEVAWSENRSAGNCRSGSFRKPRRRIGRYSVSIMSCPRVPPQSLRACNLRSTILRSQITVSASSRFPPGPFFYSGVRECPKPLTFPRGQSFRQVRINPILRWIVPPQ
jgi:hypothetical protein